MFDYRFCRSTGVLLTVVAAGVTALSAQSLADPLDPNAYSAIGSLDAATGTVTFNTDTLSVSGPGFSMTGTSQTQSGGPSIAVFDFNNVTIGSGVTVQVTGSKPIAILSRNDITIAPKISLNGADGAPAGFAPVCATGCIIHAPGGAGGPGGGSGGAGGSPDTDTSPYSPNFDATAGFAGLGRRGGNGGAPTSSMRGGNGAFGYPGQSISQALVGGSGGGGSGGNDNGLDSFGAGGGGGGGAIELSAKGVVNLGAITANGGAGGAAGGNSAAGGSGSGGGILIKGASVAATSFSAASIYLAPDTYVLGNTLPTVNAAELAPGNTIIPKGSALNLAGGTAQLDGHYLLEPSNVTVQGTLTGDGKLGGTLTNSGLVSPGTSDKAGTFEVANFSQTSTGVLVLKIGGTSPGIDFDQLIVDGNAALAGSLEIDLFGGFRPVLGETFSLIGFGSHDGEFDRLIGRELGGGLFFEEIYGRDGLELAVCNANSCPVTSAVPEPSTWAMMILGFCSLGFLAYRRRDYPPPLATSSKQHARRGVRWIG